MKTEKKNTIKHKTTSIILLVFGGLAAFALMSNLPMFVRALFSVFNSSNANDIAYFAGFLTAQLVLMIIAFICIYFGIKQNKKAKHLNK